VMKCGIKVIANAGGINRAAAPRRCRPWPRQWGLSPRIAVVEGDDVERN